MSFLVDGTITYTQEGKINCTIVDIENKQKYTIDQSSITKTAAASEEDIAKLISGSQSDESGDVGGPTGVSTPEGAVIQSDTSSDDENPQQDTVAEQINTEIKNKKIPDVTKLEFVLQKSPETGADAAVQKIAVEGTGTVAVEGPTGTVAVEGTGSVEGVTGPVAVEGLTSTVEGVTGSVEGSAAAGLEGTGPVGPTTNINTSSSQSP